MQASARAGSPSTAARDRNPGPCLEEVELLDLGGLALTYTSTDGHDRDLEESLKAMAERHNSRRVDVDTAVPTDGASTKPVRSVAVVETTNDGPRLILMPADPDSLPELYVNVVLHAPDVVPLRADPGKDCDADAEIGGSP